MNESIILLGVTVVTKNVPDCCNVEENLDKMN